MAGIGLVYGKDRPYWFETGLIATRKGWRVTTPKLQAWYVEVPALLHVGFRPRGWGVGASVAAGGALDIAPFKVEDSRPAAMVAAQVYTSMGGRSLWSLGVRYSRGATTNHDLYVHAITFFLNVAPQASDPSE